MLLLQPERWPHPGLLGMDALGSHRCDFHFDVPRVDLDRDEWPAAAWYPLKTATAQHADGSRDLGGALA